MGNSRASDDKTSRLLPDPSVQRVARVVDDLRRGFPVYIKNNSESGFLAIATEKLSPEKFSALQSLGSPRLAITNRRAETLSISHKGKRAVCLSIKGLDIETIKSLADPTLDLANPLRGPFSKDENGGELEAETLIQLCRMARLLPSVLLVTSGEVPAGISTLSASDVDNAQKASGQEMECVASANLPMADAEEAKIHLFRPIDGGPEHLAIIIGKPDTAKPVLVRIHSECFTGDVLGSLKCDCGPQLKGAIRRIQKEGGGIILYLAQEGRGIGLSSKLKAYRLQDQGFDTVDANIRLGFEDDERTYDPAATMLKALNVKTVRLLTNNPQKMDWIQKAGIQVSERVPHNLPSNPHNAHYIDTKKRRSGHLS